MLKQLSIYAENKKGNLQHITRILADENINIWGSVTNDSAEYGIIRMVVSDAEKAKDALEKENFLCRLTDIIGVEMDDEVGNLNRLLQTLSESNINVDYIYLSFSDTPVEALTDKYNYVRSCNIKTSENLHK